ncbi:T9SS type A sorting domain-containing protein [Candidatus Fermentibacteria bacterium]|nr:T9SS type A sorting domain-containing protein [Candidatus Fermentibacteria bacterium]
MLAQAPGIVWEREYDDITIFHDVITTSDSRILCAGYRGASQTSLWCFDSSGDVLWTFGIPGTGQTGRRIATSPTGSFAVVGEVASVSDYDLFIASCSGDGSPLWQTILEKPSTQDLAFDVAALPDGGFAVCGYTQDSILATQAWILRFDSAGDTLWTRTWGLQYIDKAVSLVYLEGGITVLIRGRPQGSDYRPVLQRYSLDGELLWTVYQEYTGVPNDLCVSAEGGYCLMKRPFDMSSYTTYYVLDTAGSVLDEIPVVCQSGHEEMRTIIPTADGGYLVAGAEGHGDEPPATWNAHISRYDQAGGWMWTDIVQSGEEWKFYSAAQFPQGGYIAAGYHQDFTDASYALLVRYEPELSVPRPDIPSGLAIESCVPNPGTAIFSLNWSSNVSGTSGIRVYDISGRLRLDHELGLMSEGEHSSQIDLQALPSGCYFAVVTCGTGRASAKLVVLR